MHNFEKYLHAIQELDKAEFSYRDVAKCCNVSDDVARSILQFLEKRGDISVEKEWISNDNLYSLS